MNHFKFIVYLILAIGFSSVRADDLVSFFRAVQIDNVRTVQELLAKGLDPNSPDPKGQVALYVALREGSVQVVAALAAHPRIQIDATNPAQETPLMMAALRGDLASARLLLDKGAAVNRNGWTPLHYAATGAEPRMVALLLDRGADLEAVSPNRSTPLMMAARYGAEESVQLLLARGASPKVRNDVQMNAADFARSAGREKLAARLDEAAR